MQSWKKRCSTNGKLVTRRKSDNEKQDKYSFVKKTTHSRMQRLLHWLSILTFISSTLTVASICYEGMILQWFSFVAIAICFTDLFFLAATVAGLVYYRNRKPIFYGYVLSAFVIVAGIIVTLVFHRDIPKILFLLWEFYILYFYGIVVCKKLWIRRKKKIT